MELMDFSTDSEGIDQAYKELSRQAFAVWVRMMTMSAQEYQGGRRAFAKKIGYSEPGANKILLELSRKGYIRIKSSGPFAKTEFALKKRLILKGEDRIIKLG